jgi:hypothetical protein
LVELGRESQTLPSCMTKSMITGIQLQDEIVLTIISYQFNHAQPKVSPAVRHFIYPCNAIKIIPLTALCLTNSTFTRELRELGNLQNKLIDLPNVWAKYC